MKKIHLLNFEYPKSDTTLCGIDGDITEHFELVTCENCKLKIRIYMYDLYKDHNPNIIINNKQMS